MSVKHILCVLDLLDDALDKDDGEISAEVMGRIDFLIGHPELTNPFKYEPSRIAWDAGWHKEYNRWMSKNAPNDIEHGGRSGDPAAEEADEDTDAY